MLFSRRTFVPALLAAGLAISAATAGNVMQKAVNDPGAYWSIWGPAKTSFVADPAIKSGAAQRVSISPRPGRPWDIGATAGITKPVQKGDVLLLVFWARTEKPPAGSDLVMLSGRIYDNAGQSNAITQEANFLIGKQWKAYYASGRATKDYPGGTLVANMFLGTGEQVIDFGPVTVLDFGPDYSTLMLPHN